MPKKNARCAQEVLMRSLYAGKANAASTVLLEIDASTISLLSTTQQLLPGRPQLLNSITLNERGIASCAFGAFCLHSFQISDAPSHRSQLLCACLYPVLYLFDSVGPPCPK
jgi:hypothetical protein